jgi:hypothetical protein
MLIYDYSQIHYSSLINLFFEGRATYNIASVEYAMKYLNEINTISIKKMESMTRYFIDVKCIKIEF